jgi:CRISPR-associated protein Csb2
VERDRPPDGVDIVRPRCSGPLSKGDDFVYRRVLCPAPGFQASDLWQVRGGSATDHLVDALIERKMPLPHGAQWVEYALPARLLVHEVYVPRKSALPTLATVPVAEVRFRLNCRIPIPATLLVAVARAFRDEAVRTYRSLTSGQPSRALTGREADGSVAKGHRHLFYLPRLRENTLWVEHLHVVVPEGHLRPDELEALLRVQRIRPARLPYPVTVVLEELIETRAPAPKSCQWISVTPFLMPLRHRRPRQIKTYEEEAAEWMKRLLGVYPQAVRLIPGPGGSGTALPLLAHRYDHGSWTFTRRLGRWLLVTFPHPISIDSPIGGDAHFGAGQFDARPHGGSV